MNLAGAAGLCQVQAGAVIEGLSNLSKALLGNKRLFIFIL
jgi:hypothetical protein